MMMSRVRNQQSIGNPPWTKRLLSFWNTENIKVVRRVIVSVIGVTVLLIGIALLVLPGPAFIVIPVGLAILATEYAWARRWLKKFAESRAMSFPVAHVQHPKIPVFRQAAPRLNQDLLLGVATGKSSPSDNSW